MKTVRACIRFACLTIFASGLSAAIPTLPASNSALLMAQSPSEYPGTVELEQFLFVQAPEQDNGKGTIEVIWLPQQLEKFCLGKTATQCSTIDYCIRTTNRDTAQCKNLGVDLGRIAPYPASTRPPRMMSVSLMYLSPDKFPKLQAFYKRAPKESLKRLSMSARIKARIRFTPNPNFYGLDLLDVLAVPPF